MIETSIQARFLIPMAISLAFGILFATGITLLLVPSIYLVLADVKHHLLVPVGRYLKKTIYGDIQTLPE